jgi:hypothetical protein
VFLEYREYKAMEQGDVSGLITEGNTPAGEGQGGGYRRQGNDEENQGGNWGGGGGANAQAPAQARPAPARNNFQGTGITLGG